MKHCAEASQDQAILPSTHMKLPLKSRIIGIREQEQNRACCMQTSVSWILCTVTCVQQPANNPEAAVPVKLGSYECPGTIEQHVKTSHAPISSAASGKFPRTYRTLSTHQERKPSLAKENQWLKSVSIGWSSYSWFGQAVLSLSKGEEQGLCPFAARYLPSLRP